MHCWKLIGHEACSAPALGLTSHFPGCSPLDGFIDWIRERMSPVLPPALPVPHNFCQNLTFLAQTPVLPAKPPEFLRVLRYAGRRRPGAVMSPARSNRSQTVLQAGSVQVVCRVDTTFSSFLAPQGGWCRRTSSRGRCCMKTICG